MKVDLQDRTKMTRTICPRVGLISQGRGKENALAKKKPLYVKKISSLPSIELLDLNEIYCFYPQGKRLRNGSKIRKSSGVQYK